MYIDKPEYYENILNNIDINEFVENYRETYVGVWYREKWATLSKCDSITISMYIDSKKRTEDVWEHYFDIFKDVIKYNPYGENIFVLFNKPVYSDELIFQTSLQYDISEDFLRFLIDTQKRITR